MLFQDIDGIIDRCMIKKKERNYLNNGFRLHT